MKTLVWFLRKDLALFLADRNGAILTIVTPVALAALLGMLFAPPDKARSVHLLVADLDGTPRTAALIGAIDGSDTLDVEVTDEATARSRIQQGEASVAVILPKGAGEALRPGALFTGTKQDVPLLFDPSDSVEAGLTEGLLTQILMQQVAKGFSDASSMREMFRETRAELDRTVAAGTYDGPEGLRELLDAGLEMSDGEVERQTAEGSDGGGGLQPPLSFQRQEVTAAGPLAGYNTYAHNFSGMLCMFILFMGLDRAKGLIQERATGTLLRVRTCPVRPSAILVGSALSTTVIGLLVSVAVYAAGMAVFGVRVLGSPLGFALVVLAQAIFVGGFALFLTGVGRTESQIANIGSFAILVLSFLGGAWLPSFLMPDWVQAVAHATPTYWATRGLAAMTWRGLPLTDALIPVVVLLGAGGLLGAIGIRRFRWE